LSRPSSRSVSRWIPLGCGFCIVGLVALVVLVANTLGDCILPPGLERDAAVHMQSIRAGISFAILTLCTIGFFVALAKLVVSAVSPSRTD